MMHKYLFRMLGFILIFLCVKTPALQAQVTAQNSQTPPQKVTFPSMVKTTPLAAPETPELDAVSALLQAFQAENGSFTTASEKASKATPSPEPRRDKDKDSENHEAWVIELKSKEAKGQRQIQIPETGTFKLVLEAGPRFEISDRDARDGEAKIQMPAATLKTWIHFEEARDNSSLEVSDELYYVKDTLSKEREHKYHDDERAKQWFKLGLRPLPVPSDWYSPDGQAFVLRFKANQIKEFQMIWQKQRGEAPFPPGINRIGPAGGKIELPGIGMVGFGKNAIPTDTIFVLRQILDYPHISSKGIGFKDYVHVGPILSIKPVVTLNHQYLSIVKINVDKELLKNVSPVLLRYAYGSNIPDEDGYFPAQIASRVEPPTLDNPFEMEKTGIFIPIYNINSLLNSQKNPYDPNWYKNNTGFKVNALPESTAVWLTESFFVDPTFPSDVRQKMFKTSKLAWFLAIQEP